MRGTVSVTMVGLLLAGAATAWKVSGLPGWQITGELVPRVETRLPRVALSFDDGPTAVGVEGVLPVLRRHSVKATFFVTGQELSQHPELGLRLVREGHELGNHSFSHRRLMLVAEATIRDEIERTDALIRAAGHVGPIYFRAPYGKKLWSLPAFLEATGRTHVTWDVAPDSDGEPSAEEITRAVLAEARPGSIILLHPMYSSREATRLALDGILSGLRERGLGVTTVSGLIAER